MPRMPPWPAATESIAARTSASDALAAHHRGGGLGVPQPRGTGLDHLVDRQRFRLALQRALAERSALDETVDGTGDGLAAGDRAGLRLRLETRGDIGGVADGGVIPAQVVADLPDDDGTGIDADPDGEPLVGRKEGRGPASQHVLDGQRRPAPRAAHGLRGPPARRTGP